MTIDIPDSALKAIGLSLAGLAVLACITGGAYALNHTQKVDYGAVSTNETQGSSDVQQGDVAIGEPSTATTPSVSTQTNSNATQSTQAYQQTINTKLTPDAVSKYENCWSLFSQYDANLVSGDYDDASIYSNLSINGVGGISGGISPSSIEGNSTLSYSDTITNALGGIWTNAANALGNYHMAATYLSLDPGVGTSSNTQKGNQYLTTARSQLGQAKAAYVALPR